MSEFRYNLDIIFDTVVLITALITAIPGYKLGFFQSLFKALGYVAGGILGVFIAANYLSNLDSILQKVLISVIMILLSAEAGQFILGKIGLLIHKGLLFAPLKSIDSLLGSVLSAAKNFIIFYIIVTVLLASSWQPVNDIKNSKFYTTADKYLPKIFTDLKGEVDKLI